MTRLLTVIETLLKLNQFNLPFILHFPMAYSTNDMLRLLCKYYNQYLSLPKSTCITKCLYKYYSETRIMESYISINYIILPSPYHFLAAPLDLYECLDTVDTVETFLSPWTGHCTPETEGIEYIWDTKTGFTLLYFSYRCVQSAVKATCSFH